jgi:hypothetical protein
LQRKHVDRWGRGGDVQHAPKESHFDAIRVVCPKKRSERQARHRERGEHERRGSREPRQSLQERCTIGSRVRERGITAQEEWIGNGSSYREKPHPRWHVRPRKPKSNQLEWRVPRPLRLDAGGVAWAANQAPAASLSSRVVFAARGVAMSATVTVASF